MSLSKEERIQRLILETALRSQSNFQSPEASGLVPESDLYDIFSGIESRIYYTCDSPMFFVDPSFTGPILSSDFKTLNVNTMYGPNKTGLINSILDKKDCYYIFYNIWQQETNPVSYMIRGLFLEDPIVIRENKINKVLGEE